MRALFPVHRPHVGISIRTQALDLVEVRRRWPQGTRVVRVSTQALPAGLLTPTSASLNISDQAAFAKALLSVLEGVRDRAVAIDLPTACGTLALYHFDTFPAVRTEQEGLLRWRLRQEEHLTASDLQLSWQMFPASRGSSSVVSVMVVAIRHSVLEQYHQVCEDAGLIPVVMGLSTIHLLQLARVTFPTAPELYVAHRTLDSLIVVAFRDGRPVHLRVKPIRRAMVGLKEELFQTLRYFAQDEPHHQKADRTTPLYLLDETVTAVEPSSSPEASDVWLLSEHPHWAVPVYRAQEGSVPVLQAVGDTSRPPFGAMACLLAA